MSHVPHVVLSCRKRLPFRQPASNRPRIDSTVPLVPKGRPVRTERMKRKFVAGMVRVISEHLRLAPVTSSNRREAQPTKVQMDCVVS